MSPEVCRSEPYSYKSDIWSLGCILYQMVYGKTPFAHLGLVQKLQAITNSKYEINYPDHPNPALINTIKCSEVSNLSDEGIITGGMLPKLNSAIHAIESGVGKVHMIDGRIPHSLLLEIFTNTGIGTEIVPS
mgnify:CR=1 FL=1